MTAFLDGDARGLVPWYAEDALLDVNVPHWRFQQRSRDDILATLEHEEFAKDNRRLTSLRCTETEIGLALEIEQRHAAGGQRRGFREVHLLRTRESLVNAHVVWCSGVSDEATLLRQLTDAPLERA